MMPVPVHEAAWWGSLLWLGAVSAVAFIVAWLTGTRLHIRRVWYIPLLFTATFGLAAGYIAWLGLGFTDVLTVHWGWGLLAGVIAAALLFKPMSRQPVTRQVPHGRQLRWEMLWDDGIYGTAEGVLLSALPPFITWQMVHALGWTGPSGALARWSLSILAGAAVVVIHHLGYWNFRNKVLIPVTLGLSVLSVAFLVTGSWIAPVVAHILMHSRATLRGVELPPAERPGTVAATPPRLLVEIA